MLRRHLIHQIYNIDKEHIAYIIWNCIILSWINPPIVWYLAGMNCTFNNINRHMQIRPLICNVNMIQCRQSTLLKERHTDIDIKCFYNSASQIPWTNPNTLYHRKSSRGILCNCSTPMFMNQTLAVPFLGYGSNIIGNSLLRKCVISIHECVNYVRLRLPIVYMIYASARK